MLLARNCEWPTLGLILATATAWCVLILNYDGLGGLIVFPLAALLVTLQSSLQHEVLHGHPTRSPGLNEALVYWSLGFFIPYRRFKALHLRHHNNDRLTDPYDDPETFYLAWRDWNQLPRPVQLILRVNNTLAGRLLIGPAVSLCGFYGAEAKKIAAGEHAVLRAWAHHLIGALPVILIITWAGGIPLWLYVLAVSYPAMSLLMLRTFAEHRAHENAEERSIIVEFCPLFSLLFLNNNLHIVHHAHPRAPWYQLPGIYRRARADWQKRNGGYVFRSYLDLARSYLFRTKEPVAHPILRRELDMSEPVAE